jgi:D-lactate dehydrogenase
MVELVLDQGGARSRPSTARAHHGPVRRRQYGDELYAAMMVDVKRLCDPRGLLNPGVVLTDDPSCTCATSR